MTNRSGINVLALRPQMGLLCRTLTIWMTQNTTDGQLAPSPTYRS